MTKSSRSHARLARQYRMVQTEALYRVMTPLFVGGVALMFYGRHVVSPRDVASFVVTAALVELAMTLGVIVVASFMVRVRAYGRIPWLRAKIFGG